MIQVDIDKKQAREFAWAIFADIEMYISNHQEEYEQFLKDEENRKLGEAANEKHK